jgi:plastocyanin
VRSIPSRALLGALPATGVLLLALVGSVAAADQTVTMESLQFQPATVTVEVGDTVTWSNADAVPHTATADDGSFDTGTISGGASASHTFTTAGTFAYHCEVHPTMTGTVVVQAAAGGGGGGGGGGATQPPTDTEPGNEASSPGSPVPPMVLLLGAAAVLLMAFVPSAFDRRASGPDRPSGSLRPRDPSLRPATKPEAGLTKARLQPVHTCDLGRHLSADAVHRLQASSTQQAG